MPAALPDSQGMVIYVWFDALVNYLTCAGYPAEPGRFAEVWPANCHLMAKDILVRFHATMWPAMLMAAGLPLPERVFAHGYWTFTGQKISKSKGHRIDPVELAQNLAAESGARFELAVDALRYFLLREVPFGQDGEFSEEALVGRFNADLANDLGNMLNRILPLISRYCGGKTPPKSDPDPKVRKAAATAVEGYEQALETLDFSAALRAVWAFLAELNRIVDSRAPWALAKNGKTAELNATLYALAEGLRITALLVSPIMPSTAEAIELQLGAPELAGRRRWSQAGEWGVLPGNRAIRPGKPLFPRYEDRRPAPSVETPAPTPAETRTDMISYQDFQKLDLRIGEITAAEKIAGADKLLKLTVNLGGEVRTLVAGIALSYAPDQLVGKRVAVLANLQPATIRGVTSQGMALAAFREGDDKSISLLVPDRPVDTGSHIK
jgi:methionyl-tRNA synthetase